MLAYSVLFVISAGLGFFGVWLLSITPEQPMPPADQRTRILPLLAAPFRDSNFRRLIVFLSSWNFAANLAAPFFAVYMLRTLGYSMTMVIVLTTASQLSNLAALGLWGNLIDRFSNKAVLEISAPLFLACTLAWTFTGLAWVQPMTLYLLFAVHVLMGIATAGVALASGNIAMKLSPAGQATAFLAASSVVSATCAAIAPIIGGLCADFFAAHELTLAVTWKGGGNEVTLQVLNFHSWTFYFGLACLVGLYSLYRLSLVRETGGTPDPLLCAIYCWRRAGRSTACRALPVCCAWFACRHDSCGRGRRRVPPIGVSSEIWWTPALPHDDRIADEQRRADAIERLDVGTGAVDLHLAVAPDASPYALLHIDHLNLGHVHFHGMAS